MTNKLLNPKEILNRADQSTQQRAKDALSLLNNPPKTSTQLLLFEDFLNYNAEVKKSSKIKNEKGLTMQQEAAAQLLALGFALTEIYVLTHPGTSETNKNSLWVRASKFCAGKVRLRAEEIRQQADKNALMPLTEAYQKLTDIARSAVKDEVRRAALVDILKLHGEYKDKQEITADFKVEVLSYENNNKNT